MSEKSINTLFELFKEYRIEVPIVQRDYVQGRNDEHAKLVRVNILKDMKAAILEETPPLDLNFVYGKAENNVFIPIDGQQRLTTLFLLHLYAYHNDDSKTSILKRFTYKTRKSSRNFLEKLTENRSSIFMSDLPPSKEVEDSEWFVLVWRYDPTVQSVLTMLDSIKDVFGDVKDLASRLSNLELKPLVFNFLDIDDLGMEDSLYIKLNARGKPLTSFENFKARLIGRMKKLELDFTDRFEQCFDGSWTDLFWSHSKESFDQTYLSFFGILLMNKDICSIDTNWSDTLEYEKIDKEIFEIAFYTLEFLSNNPNSKEFHKFVFNALKEKRTYQDRVLFHAITTYLYKTEGVVASSLAHWMRIIKNLTLNSTIDNTIAYRSAINGINKISGEWNSLLDYFANGGSTNGFSQEQLLEEQLKASIIVSDNKFAEEIYKAEQHPYFSGQIRSALLYSKDSQGKYDKQIFIQYWSKISLLFDKTNPIHGHLLRQALLTFGDYTLQVAKYKTLCVDDPNEAGSTPSLKRLFSEGGPIVKQLLDSLNTNNDIEIQLRRIVENSTVPQNDWRYCFIKFNRLFENMSNSHLRLRQVGMELIIIPNKSSNGFNFEPFLEVLQWCLEGKGLQSTYWREYGADGSRYLEVKTFYICFENGMYSVLDKRWIRVFETKTDKPIKEVMDYIINH